MSKFKFLDIEGLPVVGNLIIELAILVAVGLLIIKVVMAITRHNLRRSSADPVLYKFILNGVKVVLLVILVTMCLTTLGVSITSIVAVIGAAGAAIALALKDSLANIAGGVMIILTKPFSQNDLIDVGSVSGRVKSIDLFLTTLITPDNKTITIPNGVINTSVLVNHSKENTRRVDCQFGISYESDIAKAKSVLRQVISDDTRIHKKPESAVVVINHGESAVLIEVRVWCSTDDYWDVMYALEENVKLAFDKEGIEIPYNKLDVHVC